MKEIFEYGKKHYEAADYVKSLRFFQQGIGGSPVGKFVLITEFESLTDLGKFYKILDKNEEWLKIKKKWSSVVDPDTLQVALWNDKLREL